MSDPLNLLAEKRAVADKERELIHALNSVLTKMSYQVVPADATDPGRRRQGRRR